MDDVVRAIPEFSGEDLAYPVTDFVRKFDTFLGTSTDERVKLLTMCRLLTESAKLLVRRPGADDYEGLRSMLLREFDRPMPYGRVYETLVNRHWRPPSETFMSYLLAMQDLASRSHMKDDDLLEIILKSMEKTVESAPLCLHYGLVIGRVEMFGCPGEAKEARW